MALNGVSLSAHFELGILNIFTEMSIQARAKRKRYLTAVIEVYGILTLRMWK
jgi:hypothetical protein